MEKSWYKSMTFWGCVALLAGTGLEAIGMPGVVATIGQVVGLPLAGFGIRRALD